jgi:dihydrofolate reductase
MDPQQVTPPVLVAIAAMARNRVIGHQGRLPWSYPEDLKFFKATTMGCPVLMGRSTYESIGRPLPGRLNLVLSRQWQGAPGVRVIRDLAELDLASQGAGRVFVIGGSQVYEQLLPRCAELYLTWIDREVPGDAFFPPFEPLFGPPEVLKQSGELEFRLYRRLAS